MNYYCDRCKIKVREHIQNCPLCGKHIDGEHDPSQSVAYPKPDLKYYRNIKSAHILTILLLLGTIACLIIDLFFSRTWWSMYVVASAVVAYFVIIYPVGRKIFYWKEIFIDVTLTFAYVVVIDYLTDWKINWSIAYIIPILCAVIALAVSITIFVTKKEAAESLLGLLIIFVFSLVFFIIAAVVFIRDSDYTIIPSFIALLVSAGFLIFIALFRFRDFTKEMFKKFRF